MSDRDLMRGTPYGKDPEPVEMGWWFVALAALVLGLLPAVVAGVCQ